MCNALKLSQNRMGGQDCGTRRSRKRNVSQVNSAAVLAIARYSASVLEREIVDCFLAHQEIMFYPKNVQ